MHIPNFLIRSTHNSIFSWVICHPVSQHKLRAAEFMNGLTVLHHKAILINLHQVLRSLYPLPLFPIPLCGIFIPVMLLTDLLCLDRYIQLFSNLLCRLNDFSINVYNNPVYMLIKNSIHEMRKQRSYGCFKRLYPKNLRN